jgi:hypothetical protein
VAHTDDQDSVINQTMSFAPISAFASRRNRAGNILMSIAIVALLLFLIALALVVFSGIFTQQRVGERAEKEGMQAARLLNNSDRVGQMNNMLVAARELMFNERSTYVTVVNDYPDLQPLARHFLDESRNAAELMIGEREHLIKITMADLTLFTMNCNGDNADQGHFGLPGVPWIKTDMPAISDLELGYMKNVDSNVQSPDGNPALWDFDLSQKYIDQTSHLYYGNLTMTLPDPDSDLNFKVCPLPAPVRGTIAPARLASNDEFQRTVQLVEAENIKKGQCDQLPTAAKLNVIINLKGVDAKVTQPMIVTATAASNGGCPRP